MAVEHASELASIVASYLRKHGFAKTLTAFLRENGGTVQEMDLVDLETLYKLHISTKANGTSKTKKLKKAKLEEGHEITKGYEDVRDDAEVKALANLHVNGGTPSERKKKKKGEKENVAADTPLVPEVDQTDVKKAEDMLTPKEKESKKKRKEEELEKADVITEGPKPLGEKFLSEITGIPGTLRHSAQEVLSNGKKSKKEKKEQGSEQPSGNVLEETRPVDIIPQVLSKKKKKKTKDIGKEETTDTSKPVSEVPLSVQTEKVDATKQPVELSCDLEGCETGSKKKKQRKDFSSGGDANGRLQEPFDASMESTKNNEDADHKKQSGKKRKIKEATTLVNEVSNQEYDTLNLSPDKTKESREDEGVNDRNVEMHKSGFAKTEYQKETPNIKKTPTGAMAFKRVEVEKVSFSDPRLGDNSYWAKDGAEEGYGAKAQEVLGLVRGRDFRHEKTKKKRGSYRGGLIGLQSHSIKFENSDED